MLPSLDLSVNHNHWSQITITNYNNEKCEILQELPQFDRGEQMLLKNGSSRLAWWCRITTNLQCIKNAVSVKHCEYHTKVNTKARYAYR